MQVQQQLYVGHAETLLTPFFPLTSHFISFTPPLSLTVTVCSPLSPLLRQLRLNLTFTHQQTAENACRKQISNTYIYKNFVLVATTIYVGTKKVPLL